MRLLGLTGDIACGKSTVATLLAKRGVAVLDADLLVRELYSRPEFASQIAALFTSSVLDERGAVDRKKLGAVVFQSTLALEKLEDLVHPAVQRLRDEKLEVLRREAYPPEVTVLEAVKLLESDQGRACEAVWCVVCAPEVQMARLMKNRGLDESSARARLASQPSRKTKTSLARPTPLIWIENNGSLADLEARVEQEWTLFLNAERP